MDLNELATLYVYPWAKPVVRDAALARELAPLLRFVDREPLEALQDLFSRSFDLSPSLPPYMGYHQHGESYRRGTLMAELRALYQAHGIDEAGELPDHLATVVRLLAVEGAAIEALVRDELKPGLDKLLALSAAEEQDNPYRSLLLATAKAMEARLA